MPHTSTVYSLLLSCPGDVLDLKDIIEECVKSFNSSLGEINKMIIQLKHWSTDSFPQSGDKPQKLLNKQFVDDCDLCVALLGTRFGTPTDNYDSGTEEEIENMLAQGKQVFLYFIERSVDPSSIDVQQYAKVKKFKERYFERGIYEIVKSKDELRKQFQNALSLYFIKLSSPLLSDVQPLLAPKLIVSSSALINNEIVLHHKKYQESSYVEEKKAKIFEIIDHIKQLIIEVSPDTSEVANPTIPDDRVKDMKTGEVLDALADKRLTTSQWYKVWGTEPPKRIKITISNDEKEKINAFCLLQNIPINDDFWDLGNLHKTVSVASIITAFNGNQTSIDGTSSEKEKYSLLKNLAEIIEDYNESVEYLAKIDNFYFASFYVSNIGTTFDEDIDLKIFIDKGHIISPSDIPQPGISILEMFVQSEAPTFLFAEKRDPEIDDYSHYPVPHPMIPIPSYPFNNAYEEIKEQQRKYNNLVEDVFCYDIRDNSTEDILCFNIPYLKQNTKMFFPSLLFFKSIPQYIRYEIRSKYSPNVYENKYIVSYQDDGSNS